MVSFEHIFRSASSPGISDVGGLRPSLTISGDNHAR